MDIDIAHFQPNRDSNTEQKYWTEDTAAKQSWWKWKDYCPHLDKDRTIRGTWVTLEVQKAVEMGYKIIYINTKS